MNKSGERHAHQHPWLLEQRCGCGACRTTPHPQHGWLRIYLQPHRPAHTKESHPLKSIAERYVMRTSKVFLYYASLVKICRSDHQRAIPIEYKYTNRGSSFSPPIKKFCRTFDWECHRKLAGGPGAYGLGISIPSTGLAAGGLRNSIF